MRYPRCGCLVASPSVSATLSSGDGFVVGLAAAIRICSHGLGAARPEPTSLLTPSVSATLSSCDGFFVGLAAAIRICSHGLGAARPEPTSLFTPHYKFAQWARLLRHELSEPLRSNRTVPT